MSLNSRKSFSLSFATSFALHILFLFILWQTRLSVQIPTGTQQESSRIVVDNITPEMLKKIREVGIKNGTGKYFSLPNKKKTRATSKARLSKNQLQLKSLGKLSQIDQIKKLEGPKPSIKERHKSKLKHYINPRHSKEITEDIKKRYELRPDIDPNVLDTLSKTDFNVLFEPPKGISEAELNKIEQIFYSFKKRIFESYVSSFLKSMYDFRYTNPNFDIFQNLTNETLTGRATFDKQGNIISIKVIRWSKNDQVQELFLSTLKGIGAVPNPPKAFVEKQETFNIYYHLVLKSRGG